MLPIYDGDSQLSPLLSVIVYDHNTIAAHIIMTEIGNYDTYYWQWLITTVIIANT